MGYDDSQKFRNNLWSFLGGILKTNIHRDVIDWDGV